MYILVNEDIKINKGKLAGQVGHAVLTYAYIHLMQIIKNHITYSIFDKYMGEQKKIILFCSQSKLEELESYGHVAIRDKGHTDLPPNTLTCVNIGIIDSNNIPEELMFIKDLKLVR